MTTTLAEILAEAMRNGHPDDGSDCDEAVYMDAERMANYLHGAGYALVQGGFWGLVNVARAMLDEHYPEDTMSAMARDSGPAFTLALRDALDTLASSAKDERC